MTASELKKHNLLRLCKEHNIGPKDATKLGKLLGAGKQHGSNLLKGKSGVGDETIRKLCVLWGIDESEFLKPADKKNDEGRPKGGDDSLEGWMLACKLLQEKVDQLEAENIRLTTGNYDRRRSGGA